MPPLSMFATSLPLLRSPAARSEIGPCGTPGERSTALVVALVVMAAVTIVSML